MEKCWGTKQALTTTTVRPSFELILLVAQLLWVATVSGVKDALAERHTLHEVEVATLGSLSANLEEAQYLLTESNTFFNKMAKATGLKMQLPKPPNTEQQIAKPMLSAKDLDLNVKIAHIEVQKVGNTYKKISAGFVPPHLRHTIKKPVVDDGEAGIQLQVEAPLPYEPIQGPVKIPSPVISSIPIRNPSPTRSSVRSGHKQTRDDIATVRTPSPDILKGSVGSDWEGHFWSIVVKPLLRDLLADYKNVLQQIIFLTRYYTLNPDEWQRVLEDGPPSRKRVAQISRESSDHARQKIESEHQQQVEEIRKYQCSKIEFPGSKDGEEENILGIDGWWALDTPDFVSEWASKLQQSHLASLVYATKELLKEEKDPIRSTMLYKRLEILVRQAKKSDPDSENLIDHHPTTTVSGQLYHTDPGSGPLVDTSFANAQGGEDVKHKREELSLLAGFTEKSENGGEGRGVDDTLGRLLETAAIDRKGEGNGYPQNSSVSHQRENRFTRATVLSAVAALQTTNIRPQETSVERREREKIERMAEIMRDFDLKKDTPSISRSEIEGLEETPTKVTQHNQADEGTSEIFNLLTFDSEEASGDKTNKPDDIHLKAVLDARMAAEAILQKAEANGVAEEHALLGRPPDEKAGTNAGTNGLHYTGGIAKKPPQLGAEDLAAIREINRQMVPVYAATDPWQLNVELQPSLPGEEPVIVCLECTDTMPFDFIRGLRGILGTELFTELAKSPDFRKVVMDTTSKFYDKMANQWGLQFAYGLAD
ncbi:hypothetical protein DRE_04856 [Drechslerella stenobrocha 248]|uniref:Uncharacterized protein n=1 Tax=Drechslerella stenobrocha 248 TaxID=1043628 RepID=W7HRM0_9PEZI|nr:hypothetical protein DRE_04856 [Drechslerella stenobrocha 248]